MRELKFRVWDQQKSRMYHFDLSDVVDGAINPVVTSTGSGVAIYPQFNLQQGIVEQYTGLKDKNGVEIYEGDLVNCRVGAYEGEGEVWIRNGIVDFLAPSFTFGGYVGWYCDNFKVVGNIHESRDIGMH